MVLTESTIQKISKVDLQETGVGDSSEGLKDESIPQYDQVIRENIKEEDLGTEAQKDGTSTQMGGDDLEDDDRKDSSPKDQAPKQPKYK